MSELILLLQTSPSLFLVLIGTLGLVVGSFLNVVIYRLPIILEKTWQEQSREILNLPAKKRHEPSEKTFNLCWPQSHCPICKTELTFYHNIPVVSYLLLRGKCAYCQSHISLRYPIVELLSGGLSAWLGWHYGVSWETIWACLFTWTLIPLIFIDIDHQILPDNLTFPLLWAGLLINLWGVFAPYSQALIGATAGYMTLWTVNWIYYLLTKRTGMGHGDFKLLAAIGAWVGWQLLPLTLILASAAGSIVGIGLMFWKGHNKHSAISFGPFLAISGWIALVYGKLIMQTYLKFFM